MQLVAHVCFLFSLIIYSEVLLVVYVLVNHCVVNFGSLQLFDRMLTTAACCGGVAQAYTAATAGSCSCLAVQPSLPPWKACHA